MGATHAGLLRQEVAEKEKEYKRRCRNLIRKFDTNGSNKLERPQLIAWLAELDSSTPPGTLPTEEEVNWILGCCDKDRDGAISALEAMEAMGIWKTYVSMRPTLDATLAKYIFLPTNGAIDSGERTERRYLFKEEVRAYLQDL